MSESAIVLRVGDRAITRAEVDRWTQVVERGGAFTGFRGRSRRGTARERALALLTSSYWLIGEAARERLPISKDAVAHGLAERMSGEGEAKFRRRLRATGQTLDGLRLELQAELASEAIRQALATRAAQIEPQDVIDFFHANRAQFDIQEARRTDLIENLPSPAAAEALVRKVGSGQGFTLASKFHELVLRAPGFMSTAEKIALVEAIFAAPVGQVSPPMKLNKSWVVFVVREVVPRKQQALADVRVPVIMQLNIQRQHRIAASFSTEYVARWMARTSCRDGYVGPGCPQYHGALGAYEDPFSLKAHPLLSEQALRG